MILKNSGTLPLHTRTFLYARILLWITIPLFFLGVLFTAIQLTQQIMTLNKINSIQSEIAFKSIYEILKPQFSKESSFSDPSKLKKIFKNLKKNYGIIEIDCFDVLENKPLFDSGPSLWSPEDIQFLEEIIPHDSSAATYDLRLDKAQKRLTAYLLFRGPDHDSLYVTKVVFPLSDMRAAFKSSWKTLLIMFVLILIIGLIISQGLANAIIRPLKVLDRATQEIQQGKLGGHVKINTGDEIEALAHTFNQMSDALEEMTRKAQDSNPLTALPGNASILNNLEKRIRERQKFVMFHCDLDRFKVFNDGFGLAFGDKAIKMTADLFKKAIAEKGEPDDFVGHQGGDDFIIITRPRKAPELAKYICEAFKTSVVRQLYNKEDYEKGYILQNDRRRQNETGEVVMMQYPLLSISLAGISNAAKDFADYTDCMNRAAPVKKEVKKTMESNYLIRE